jgi:nicotinamidase-related amidase
VKKKRGKSNGTALLLVDFINPFDFPDAPRLIPRALRAARHTAKLKAKLARRGVPCIYVNDNFGEWTSEFSALVEQCSKLEGDAGEVARVLAPQPGDLSVLKPRHSAFYGTPLDFLLEELEVTNLVITGLTADICVFATAQDGYIRKYKVRVPANCVAACSANDEKGSLQHMARTMKADIRPAR